MGRSPGNWRSCRTWSPALGAAVMGCSAAGAQPLVEPPAATIAPVAEPKAPPVEVAPALAKAEEPPASAEPAPAQGAPRLTSRGYVTWIWPRPSTKGTFLGYVRVGQSIAMKTGELVRGPGCPGGFHAVEPRGYVCSDRTVTLAPDTLFQREMEATRSLGGPFPYRYAISNGAPMYNRIPTPAEQLRFERPLGRAGWHLPLPKTLSAHEDLAVEEAIAPGDPLPWFLSEEAGRPKPLGLLNQTIPLGSMLSFTRAFEAAGRTWLLSAEGTVVPADRTRPFRKSDFRGTRLGGAVHLPLAWMRRSAKPQYRRLPSGAMEKLDASFPVRSFVALGAGVASWGGARYLETASLDPEGGAPLYVAEADATVARAEEKVPTGVAEGQKWVIVRITDGTLVAYEGLTPVYATLISPGAGGVPVRGRDPVKDSTTPMGVYYVTFKDRAATMSPEQGKDRTFWIADVPHTQYFNPPFALHAAYWHERFGEPTSAGCVNLSPIDAEAVFDWSDPEVPAGWQGATGAGATRENGPTTAVVVRR